MRINYKFNESNKQEYQKNDDAFDSKNGVCYKDYDGIEYTYNDLLSYTRDDEGTKELYKNLYGESPLETLKDNPFFYVCDRCGTWRYKDKLFSRESYHLCRFCTPLRTNGKIHLEKDPYNDDRCFYHKKEAKFEPGITTLVGCNGIGKTTLIQNIKTELKKRGTPYLDFDNLGSEGGENRGRGLLGQMLGGYGMYEQTGPGMSLYDDYGCYLSSSEGEKIISSLASFSSKIRRGIEEYRGYGEIWLLFDAIDSGLSLDMIQDIKEHLLFPLDAMNNMNRRHFNVYIIISSNSYEMSEGTNCFSVEKMKYISIRSYNAYKNAVFSSREYKKKRDNVFRVKAEIANRPFTVKVDQKLWEKIDNDSYSEDKSEGDVLTMELEPFRFVLRLRSGGYFSPDVIPSLFKRKGNDWKKVSCYDMEDELTSNIHRMEEVKAEIHAYICQKVYEFEKNLKKN